MSTVQDNTTYNHVTVTTEAQNTVQVTQPVTNIIQVNTPGPIKNLSGGRANNFVLWTGVDSIGTSSMNQQDSIIDVTGSLNISDGLKVTGSVNISGSQTFTGTSAFYGNHTLSGSNTITGNTTLSGSLEISGSSNFHNSLFIVTGSQYYSGSSYFNGNQEITGSLKVTGSFWMNGNRQFNYGAFSSTQTQALPGANQSASFTYDTVDVVDGVTYSNNSHLNIPHTGVYNIQFSTQLLSTANNVRVYIWLKKNGINLDNTATVLALRNNEEAVAAWNWIYPFVAGDYVEIAWQSNSAATTLQRFNASGNIPAVPSVIVTVTQVA